MLDVLQHRGPDASGTFSDPDGAATLGHTRLSIVDLDGGDQPLFGDDGDVLVANGEIYNSELLRAELGEDRFRTRSDSETILHLLAGGGAAATERLRGMFAFALATDDELLLARDAIGVKPLYTGREGANLVFSSELKAFPPGTSDVSPLPPGTVWSSATGLHRFYDVPDPVPLGGTLEWHATRVRRALEKAVEARLMSDVPVGAFLSGGLDSSAIAAVMASRVDELHTFSVGLPGSPDLAAAEVVARHLGSVHHVHELDPAEIASELPRIIYALESFDQDLVRSAVPTHFTARLAARHVKVVLTGEGADELFAGYTYQKEIRDPAALHRDARRSLGELHHVNLQRVDRVTMAHSLEARVPFLDLDLIETALSVPPELRMPSVGSCEKAVLRAAVADLLPAEIVWRDKAQFDEGTGAADLLPDLAGRLASHIDLDDYLRRHPGEVLRSAEECLYHELLVAEMEDPALVLANVGRWTDRD